MDVNKVIKALVACKDEAMRKQADDGTHGYAGEQRNNAIALGIPTAAALASLYGLRRYVNSPANKITDISQIPKPTLNMGYGLSRS